MPVKSAKLTKPTKPKLTLVERKALKMRDEADIILYECDAARRWANQMVLKLSAIIEYIDAHPEDFKACAEEIKEIRQAQKSLIKSTAELRHVEAIIARREKDIG